MPTDINYKNIVPRGGSQTKAFEELCTQVARKILQSTDQFERYHGDGGDGGVECIARLADGCVIGWQSKFVDNIDDLIKQASSSLATAIKIHPELNKYVICFPFDITGQTGRTDKKGRPAQSGSVKLDNWIKGSLATYKAASVALEEIEVWSANRLTELLLQHDASAGIRTYFFSDTTIPQNWFEKNIVSGIRKAGPRYNPKLTVETDVWRSFAAFGQTESWNIVTAEALDIMRKLLKDFASYIGKKSDPAFPGLDKKYTKRAKAISNETLEVLQSLEGVLTDTVLATAEENLAKVIVQVEQLERDLVGDLNKQNKGENWDNKRWRSFMSEYMITFPAAGLDRTRELLSGMQTLTAFIQSPDMKLASEKVFILSGIGGSGKTHCICDIAVQRLEDNLLSCIVFGDQFSGNPNEWTRFGEALNIRNASSDMLLDALNAAGEQSGKPLIIFIDAINETIRRDYWMTRITAFADEIAQRPFLKLCISCRTSFLRTSLPIPNPFLTIEHTGFKGFEREACNAFFMFYGLIPPLIPILQPELGNPLYLKLVCETINAKGLKQLPPGWTGLQPVIKAFLSEKERQLCQQYDLSSSGILVVTALTSIIQEITSRAMASLSWADATTTVAKSNPPITPFQLLDWLVKADLLIEDGSINDQELADITYVRPAFERLGDFLLAAEMAKQAMSNGKDHFLEHPGAQEIFRDDASIGHNATLISALSVILPENHGTELPDLFRDTSLYETVAAIATKALIWRTPQFLTYGTRLHLEATLRKDGFAVMDSLFSVCTNESKVDAFWLHDILKPTKLHYRDAFFAGYLYTSYNNNGIIKQLIDAHHDINLSELAPNTAQRWLLALIWLTAAPDRRIKDTATRAAIGILSHHNQLAADLVFDLMYVNDEEVVERLLLVIYAAQILKPHKGALAEVSAKVIENYMDTPWAFQNALVRDHIRCIAELARHLHCLPDSLDTLISMKTNSEEGWSLQVPDDSITKAWQDEGGARGLAADSAISDDFNHYSISCLSDWQRDLSKKDIGKWIIDDVINRKGLENTLHDPYDITVVQETGGRRSKPAHAERLGKKYQWNALYRLASILHDKVERKTSYSQPDFLQLPLILEEERRMDPTLTQPYFISGSLSKNWWLKQTPNLHSVENADDDDWLEHDTGIPHILEIITQTHREGQNWLPLSMDSTFSTSKKDDDYASPYRLLKLYIDAYIVKEADLEELIPRMDGKNLNSKELPGGGNFSKCYLGEYPWATICNTLPDWYLGVSNTFDDTPIEMHNVTNSVTAEYEYDYTQTGNLYVQVPSKKFFELGDLWWNGKDGYKRLDQKTVFKDPRVETGGDFAMIADYEDLIDRLGKLGYNIIWAFRGEKMLINGHRPKDRKYFSQIAWMDSSGKISFGKRVFFPEYDSKVGTPEPTLTTKKATSKKTPSKNAVLKKSAKRK